MQDGASSGIEDQNRGMLLSLSMSAPALTIHRHPAATLPCVEELSLQQLQLQLCTKHRVWMIICSPLALGSSHAGHGCSIVHWTSCNLCTHGHWTSCNMCTHIFPTDALQREQSYAKPGLLTLYPLLPAEQAQALSSNKADCRAVTQVQGT